jgi:cell filamentation protein
MQNNCKYIDPEYVYTDPETFLRLLALERNLILNLNPPDNADIYERYMSGTIRGDVEELSMLILELITA